MAMAFSEAKFDFQRVLYDDGRVFPLVLTPTPTGGKDATYLASQAAQDRAWIASRLAESGAVLFRGFEVRTAQDFNEFVEALGWKEFEYIQAGGKAARTRVYGRVLTVNENVPLEQKLRFHNEASYLVSPPGKIILFCETPAPPGTGGATPIVHGRNVYRRLVSERKDFVEELRKRKLMTTLTTPRTEVFKEDGMGRVYWHNYLGFILDHKSLATEMKLAYGDGEPVPQEDLGACLKIMEEEKVEFPWKQGDILLVDNFAVQHGRQGCTSSTRNILISLCE